MSLTFKQISLLCRLYIYTKAFFMKRLHWKLKCQAFPCTFLMKV